MERAIVYKEWVKTRKIFILCLTVSVLMAVYVVLRMNRLIELKGAEHLWLIMLLKDTSFVELLKWTPPACAVAISLAQMLPEMSHKRLKLTLHLPYPQYRMILIMLATGIAEVLSIYIVQALIIGIYDSLILPSQLVYRVLLTIVPWFCAGLTAYLFAASICIEGKNLRRVILGLIGVSMVLIYFEQPAMEAYNYMIPISIIFLVILFILPLGSVIRFKEGLQD